MTVSWPRPLPPNHSRALRAPIPAPHVFLSVLLCKVLPDPQEDLCFLRCSPLTLCKHVLPGSSYFIRSGYLFVLEPRLHHPVFEFHLWIPQI